MAERPRLSLVLPVFDEERVLEAHLGLLCEALHELGETFELVCVDDGSTDATPELLARASRRIPELVTLRWAVNRGKGAAVRAGMLAARGERVVCMDADLSTDLGALPRALALLDAGGEVVVGDRRVRGARVVRRQPRLRESLGRTFTFLARRLIDASVTDFTCGFKAFRRDVAEPLFERVSVRGWAYDAEVLAIARGLGLEVTALPVEWTDREGTRVRLGRDAPRALVDLVRIGWRARRGDYAS